MFSMTIQTSVTSGQIGWFWCAVSCQTWLCFFLSCALYRQTAMECALFNPSWRWHTCTLNHLFQPTTSSWFFAPWIYFTLYVLLEFCWYCASVTLWLHFKDRQIFKTYLNWKLVHATPRHLQFPLFNAWSCWSSIPVVSLNFHRFSNLTVVVEVVVHLVALVCLVAGEAQAGPELWAQAKKPRFELCFLQPYEVQLQLSAQPPAAWVASRNAPTGEDPRNEPATTVADPVLHGHLVAGVVLGRLKLPTWQWQSFLNTTVLKLCAVLPFQPKPQRVAPGDKWHPELESQLPKSIGTQLVCLVCTTSTFRLSGSVLPAVWPLWVCTIFHQEPVHQAKANQPWTTQHPAAMSSLYPTAQDPPILSAV